MFRFFFFNEIFLILNHCEIFELHGSWHWKAIECWYRNKKRFLLFAMIIGSVKVEVLLALHETWQVFSGPYFPVWRFNRIFSLSKNCPYSKLLWSVFSHIQTIYGEIRCISPYSAWMRENTVLTQENMGMENMYSDIFYAVKIINTHH